MNTIPILRRELYNVTTGQQISAPADSYDVVLNADAGGVSGIQLIFANGSRVTFAQDASIKVGGTGEIIGTSALRGEYYTASYASNGTINEIGGRASFNGSAPCGTVSATHDITIQDADLSGCARDYSAGGSITVGNGVTLGDETTLRS